MDIVFSLSILILINKHKNPKRTLVLGSYMGLLFCTLFSIAEFLNWPISTIDVGRFMDLSASSAGSFAPRLSGVSLDPNRGGLLIVIYSF